MGRKVSLKKAHVEMAFGYSLKKKTTQVSSINYGLLHSENGIFITTVGRTGEKDWICSSSNS